MDQSGPAHFLQTTSSEMEADECYLLFVLFLLLPSATLWQRRVATTEFRHFLTLTSQNWNTNKPTGS